MVKGPFKTFKSLLEAKKIQNLNFQVILQYSVGTIFKIIFFQLSIQLVYLCQVIFELCLCGRGVCLINIPNRIILLFFVSSYNNVLKL